MNKQKKQTLIVAIVLVVLVGLYFLVPLIPDSSEDVSEVSETLDSTIDAADVNYINFEGTEEELTFTRATSEDVWVLEGYEDREVNETYVNLAINSAVGIAIDTKIENVSDYSQFGFDDPEDIVTVKTANETHVLTFGSYNAVTGVHYVMIDDDPTVYVYTHSQTLPYDYETEHYLVEEEEEETEETTEASDESETSADAAAASTN